MGDRIIDNTFEQNLTGEDFFIQKAEIEIRTKDGDAKLLAMIKYNANGKYLISIRSKAGIEAARVYLTKDTILINDRINRKLFWGSTRNLENKYGLTTAIVPLLFGDFIDNNMEYDQDIKCLNGSKNKEVNIQGIVLKYVIDCSKGKTVMVNVRSILYGEGLQFKYSSFFKRGGRFIPGIIEINDPKRETTIFIEIVKIEIPWEGELDFSPGDRYENIELR